MAFLDSIDVTKPDGSTEQVNVLDNYQRELRAAVKNTIQVEHDLSNGEHLAGQSKIVFVGLKSAFPAAGRKGSLAIATDENDTLYYDTGSTWAVAAVNMTVDTEANLPAAGTTGRMYFTSDTKRLLIDSGSAWQEIERLNKANIESWSTGICFAYNAYHDGTDWYCVDTAKPAFALSFDETNKIQFFYSPPTAGIISWTTLLTLSETGQLSAVDDITMQSGKTVDGVDISAHAADANAHHTPLFSAKYDSGWFAVAANTEYTKTHNLGTEPLLAAIWFKNSSGIIFLVMSYTEWRSAIGESGMYLRDVTSSGYKLKTGAHYVFVGNNESYSSGYARVILVA